MQSHDDLKLCLIIGPRSCVARSTRTKINTAHYGSGYLPVFP